VHVLHSTRSLLCTLTNATPRKRCLFISTSKRSLPSWLVPARPLCLLRKREASKSCPLCGEVELIEATTTYAYVNHHAWWETIVSLQDLAPYSKTSVANSNSARSEPFVNEPGDERRLSQLLPTENASASLSCS